MPRGQYDRTKAKMKREAAKQATTAVAAVSAKPTKDVIGKAEVGPALATIGPLHSHLNILTQTRVSLAGQQMEHNAQLLNTVDQELIATIQALRNWRETSYGIVEERRTTSGKSIVSATALPPPPPMVGGNNANIPAPAPLPFTPEAVQKAMT